MVDPTGPLTMITLQQKRPAPQPLPRVHLLQLLLWKLRQSLLSIFGIQWDGLLEASLLVPVNTHRSRTVTWSCYKPIIGEVDTRETSIRPITFADLAVHPEVRRVSICASAASAHLPEVEIENKAGQHYLLQGVVL